MTIIYGSSSGMNVISKPIQGLPLPSSTKYTLKIIQVISIDSNSLHSTHEVAIREQPS